MSRIWRPCPKSWKPTLGCQFCNVRRRGPSAQEGGTVGLSLMSEEASLNEEDRNKWQVNNYCAIGDGVDGRSKVPILWGVLLENPSIDTPDLEESWALLTTCDKRVLLRFKWMFGAFPKNFAPPTWTKQMRIHVQKQATGYCNQISAMCFPPKKKNE